MHPSRYRERSISLISMPSSRSKKLLIDIPKTPPTSVLTVRPGPSDAIGSFTTTSSASAFLQKLAFSNAVLRPTHRHVQHRRQKSCPAPVWTHDDISPSRSPSAPTSPISMDSPQLSPPSISRTSSSFSPSDNESAATSQTALSDSLSLGEKKQATEFNKINPILASLERKSRLCSRTICVTCSKTGLDFPKCAKCGDMWCSRACRLKGGKRHVC
jgi:hypothetical protein